MNQLLLSFLNKVIGNNGRPLKKQNEYMFWSPFVSHHKPKLQINIVTQKWHCWVSNEGGRNFYQLLKKLNSSRGYYKELSEILDDDFYTYSEEKPQTEEVLTLPKEYKTIWPNFIDNILGNKIYRYLQSRGVEAEEVLRNRIGFCQGGLYDNRIIIPSYDSDGKLNYFVGRDIDNSKLKYKNPPVSKDVIGFELFINWDLPIVLCEGVFDAIAIKRNAIPLFGKTIPRKLLKKIIENGVSKITIVLDSDATIDLVKLTQKLKSYGVECNIVPLKNGDPSEIGFEKITRKIMNSSSLKFIDEVKFKMDSI